MSQLSQHSEEVGAYLAGFTGRYSAAEVLKHLEDAQHLKVLAIGEAIIDEYQSCDALGKSGKEPVLAMRYLSAERHAGGILACANHLASFCHQVDVITMLGEGGDQEDFVRSSLKANVRPTFFYKAAAPTILKTRFLERYLAQKLFEVYHMNDDALSDEDDAAFCEHLRAVVPGYDVVIVADYGHGMISPAAVDVLCATARWLAVNTQSNAGNHGFNMVSKYARADYVCLAHREFMMELRNRRLSPEEMVLHVAGKLDAHDVLLTQGKFGSLAYSVRDGFFRVPAFAAKVVDRVGAGDAVLCVTSLCVAQQAPPEIAGFIGNVAGAEAVMILGNQRSIEREALFGHIEALMTCDRASELPSAPTLSIARAA
jgi:bifunctional ADP-heptose synthase (sugar kinase/adenylyltransferase)